MECVGLFVFHPAWYCPSLPSSPLISHTKTHPHPHPHTPRISRVRLFPSRGFQPSPRSALHLQPREAKAKAKAPPSCGLFLSLLLSFCLAAPARPSRPPPDERYVVVVSAVVPLLLLIFLELNPLLLRVRVPIICPSLISDSPTALAFIRIVTSLCSVRRATGRVLR